MRAINRCLLITLAFCSTAPAAVFQYCVPVLLMIGQYDEFGGTMRDASGRESWQGGRDAVVAFREEDPRHLASLLVEPGAGHFAWSRRNAEYLALFVRQAAQARIPENWNADDRPVVLNKIDPTGGWLTDLAVSSTDHRAPAPYGEYRGEAARAAWHFDRQLAEATVAYHTGGFGRKDQFIRWDDPYWVDAGARFFFTKLRWIGDGQTLEVHPVYADKYPTQHDGRGPRWAEEGQKVGRSTASIFVRRVGGPVVATGPNRLRIQYDNLAPAAERSRVTFLAYSEGDAQYRYTEQVGMMPRGFRGLTKGKQQTITFPPIDDLETGADTVVLEATSDVGSPVEYYVAHGPAIVEDGRLRIAELPARAKFPVEVRVVACQFGRGVEPLVQTATPVEQSFRVLVAGDNGG